MKIYTLQKIVNLQPRKGRKTTVGITQIHNVRLGYFHLIWKIVVGSGKKKYNHLYMCI